MRIVRPLKIVSSLLLAFCCAAPSAVAAADCLNDDELGVVVRSVFTRSLGRVMRACATQHPSLEERARDATTGFLTSYSEDMRANRLAANSIMMRVMGAGWEAAFEKMLLESTASDEMRARSAPIEECENEIARVEAMVSAGDYRAVMDEGLPRRLFDEERARIPVCK